MMSKTKLFPVFSVLCVVLLCSRSSDAALPDQMQCVDVSCSKTISEGLTMANAPAGHFGMLSIQKNRKILILSKNADEKIYGISYQGQKGFVSAIHVREDSVKVSFKDLIGVATVSIPWHADKLKKTVVPAVEPTKPTSNEQPDSETVTANSVPVVEPLVIKKTAYETTESGSTDIKEHLSADTKRSKDEKDHPVPATNTIADANDTIAAETIDQAHQATQSINSETKNLNNTEKNEVHPIVKNTKEILTNPESTSHSEISKNADDEQPTLELAVPTSDTIVKSKFNMETATVSIESGAAINDVSNDTATGRVDSEKSEYDTVVSDEQTTKVDPPQTVSEENVPEVDNKPPVVIKKTAYESTESGSIDIKEDLSVDAKRSNDETDLSVPATNIVADANDTIAAQTIDQAHQETTGVESKISESDTVALDEQFTKVDPPRTVSEENIREVDNKPPVTNTTQSTAEAPLPVEFLQLENFTQSETIGSDPTQPAISSPSNSSQVLEDKNEVIGENIDDVEESDNGDNEEEIDNESEEDTGEKEEEVLIQTNESKNASNETIPSDTILPNATDSFTAINYNSQFQESDTTTESPKVQYAKLDSTTDTLKIQETSETTQSPQSAFEQPHDVSDHNSTDQQLASEQPPVSNEQTQFQPEPVQQTPDQYYSQPPQEPTNIVPSPQYSPEPMQPVSGQYYDPYAINQPSADAPRDQANESEPNYVPVPPIDGIGMIEEVTAVPVIDVYTPEVITEANPEMITPSNPDVWGTISNWFGSSNSGDVAVASPEHPAPESGRSTSGGLYSETEQIPIVIGDNEFCDALTNSCPAKKPAAAAVFMDTPPPPAYQAPDYMESSGPLVADLGVEGIVQLFVDEVAALTIVFVYSFVTGLIVLLFLLGNRFVNKRQREQTLLSKLNILERKLMTSCKECDLMKSSLVDTKQKLSSIEDNSFGSNEMVISLRKDVTQKTNDCLALQEQIQGLEIELETATEAGLELNKMVSELLSNQTGSDSIISSVEEMQRQLNEQEETTAAINTLLAEKSRENSELQVQLLSVTEKYDTELAEVVNQNEQLVADLDRIQTELNELQKRTEDDRTQSSAAHAAKLSASNAELAELRATYEKVRVANVSNEARVQVLEDLVKELRSGQPIDGKLMDATKQKTLLLALTKEKERLTDKLDGEQDARRLLEDHVKVIGEEMNALRQGFSAAEKDKLEAQTRLEVLSTYFKDKETQLQKELSLKEAITMKQQGETTSTVERIRGLQTDIQDLRSQNDSLKAEIEAQLAAHKVQMAAAENRAHESWLSARQSNRRYEEAVSEAGALRRKLTSLGDVSGGGQQDTSLPNLHRSMDAGLSGADAPSPILMDVSGANQAMLMGVLPPPSFLPPPFMAPPPMLPPPLNFMPPPQAPLLPFMPGQHLPPPPGEMRPPPLGRLMSPPPQHQGRPGSGGGGGHYSPDGRYRSGGGGRYSDEDEYDSEDDHHHRRRRHHSNRSPYDTETDYSPPRSPEPSRYGRGGSGGRPASPLPPANRSSGPYSSPPPTHSNNSHNHQSSRTTQQNSKGGQSSGSVDSLGSRKSHHGAKV